MNKAVQVVLIQVCLSVTVYKLNVRQQRSSVKFLLGDNVESPSLFVSQSLGNRQLALCDRAIESLGGFYFHEPPWTVAHLDQKVGHDIAGAG